MKADLWYRLRGQVAVQQYKSIRIIQVSNDDPMQKQKLSFEKDLEMQALYTYMFSRWYGASELPLTISSANKTNRTIMLQARKRDGQMKRFVLMEESQNDECGGEVFAFKNGKAQDVHPICVAQ